MIYREDTSAVFFRTIDPLGQLSNMCGGLPIRHQNRLWKSSEALYQACRYPNEPDIHAVINEAPNGFMAKKIAYGFKEHTRADWQTVNVDIMEAVLRLKMRQNTIVSQVLDETVGRPIVEKSSKDDFWGAIPDRNGNLVGENVLGILWQMLELDRTLCHKHIALPLFI